MKSRWFLASGSFNLEMLNGEPFRSYRKNKVFKMREFSAKGSYTNDGIVEKPIAGECGDPGNDVDLLLGFLEAWRKKWSMVSEVETPAVPWKLVEIGLKGSE